MAQGGDPELEELRRRRLRQLQDEQTGSAGQAQAYAAQQAEAQRRDAERAEILRRILSPEARERLGRIRLAKPDIAASIEQQLISLAASGRLQRQVDDATLRSLLERMMPEKRDITITRR
jgi:programmed cell death protein 5